MHGQRPIKIGVHGISVGGLAATRLGRSGLVDFLMVDRSFSDLLVIPRQASTLLPPLLKGITLWQNPDCAFDYLYTNCYKVLANDPSDEIISDICSLKTGVSLHIIKSELDHLVFERALSGKSMVLHHSMNISEYFHILNCHETELFFQAIQAVFEQIFELEIDNRSVRRRFCLVGTLKSKQGNDRDERTGSSTHRAVSSRIKKN